jgi:hypothetical protein
MTNSNYRKLWPKCYILPNSITFTDKYTMDNSNDAILHAILASLTQIISQMTENNLMLKEIDHKMHKLLINTNS